ncbi:hypothetical protein L596_028840 [Steinernema carpocapsae]|uniref:DOMON domain-containing protein n=1 Tax=Steinernema carpocapsae TaxID=34508 RepID=A0A4V5ZY04_STECR|nr:hypothetical protein L596_028840 [Steinernema carpocapsae]
MSIAPQLGLILALMLGLNAAIKVCDIEDYGGYLLFGIKDNDIVAWRIPYNVSGPLRLQNLDWSKFKTIRPSPKGDFKYEKTKGFTVDGDKRAIMFYYETDKPTDNPDDKWYHFGEVMMTKTGDVDGVANDNDPMMTNDLNHHGQDVTIFKGKLNGTEFTAVYKRHADTGKLILELILNSRYEPFKDLVRNSNIPSKVFDWGEQKFYDRGSNDINTGILYQKHGLEAKIRAVQNGERIAYHSVKKGKRCVFGRLQFPTFKQFHLVDFRDPEYVRGLEATPESWDFSTTQEWTTTTEAVEETTTDYETTTQEWTTTTENKEETTKGYARTTTPDYYVYPDDEATISFPREQRTTEKMEETTRAYGRTTTSDYYEYHNEEISTRDPLDRTTEDMEETTRGYARTTEPDYYVYPDDEETSTRPPWESRTTENMEETTRNYARMTTTDNETSSTRNPWNQRTTENMETTDSYAWTSKRWFPWWKFRTTKHPEKTDSYPMKTTTYDYPSKSENDWPTKKRWRYRTTPGRRDPNTDRDEYDSYGDATEEPKPTDKYPGDDPDYFPVDRWTLEVETTTERPEEPTKSEKNSFPLLVLVVLLVLVLLHARSSR